LSEFDHKDPGKFETLVEIVKKLRSPEGCPWDREQTHETLRQFAVEEAYEVVEAIEGGNPEKLREELGDLLLQVVLHAQIAAEEGRFDIAGVTEGISKKLINRHRWVFGDETAESPQAVLASWNRIKVEERGGPENGASILSGIPEALPALFTALSLSKRAAQVGFDWERTQDVIKKLHEEVRELEKSVASGSERDIEAELGDILFVIANTARKLGVNPELALQRSNRKFRRRFRYIEEKLAEQGKTPQDSTLEEMDALWDEAKALEEE
jgi:tetrapyrrole methylase family protein/MazG family protein